TGWLDRHCTRPRSLDFGPHGAALADRAIATGHRRRSGCICYCGCRVWVLPGLEGFPFGPDRSVALRMSTAVERTRTPRSLQRCALKHAEIANVAALADLPARHGSFDSAAVLMRVRAIGIRAQRHERPKLREEAFDFLWQDVPELELPDARCIDHPAT